MLLYDVTNTNDAGPGSLRQAILDLNANADGDWIYMKVAGGSEAQPRRIELLSPLPVITRGTRLENGAGIAARSVLITTATGLRGAFDGIVASTGIWISGQAISGFRHGLVLSGFNNGIGFSSLANRNAIFGNTGDGVRFIGPLGSGYVSMSDLYDNGGMAIDNGGDGPNPNDPGDADDGNNGLLNSPIMLSARIEENKITVRFSTSSLPTGWGYESHFDFFLGSSSAVGQGGKIVFSSTLGYKQEAVFSFPIPAEMPSNPIISASFTHVGLTSELSAPVPVEGLPIYVTSSADSGSGSFREAILLANANPGFDNVRFNLPPAQRQINLLSALPQITGPLMIDGTGIAAPPEKRVRINGAGAPADSDGLVIAATESCVVRGLEVTGFRHGVVISAGNGHVIGQATSWANTCTAWNYIYRNRGDGIRVTAGTEHNLRYNSLAFNGGLPIDLGGDGLDPVDVGDVDTGPNGRTNAPILERADYYENRLNVSGMVRGQGGFSYVVDLWAVPPSDAGGDAPQARSLGFVVVTPVDTADKRFVFSQLLYNENFVGWNFFATASVGPTGSTSEVSSTPILPAPRFYVTSTADSGHGSLRQALLDANETPGLNNITFAILPSAVIELVTPLPEIAEAVHFNGGAGITPVAAQRGMFDGLILASSDSMIGNSTVWGFRHGIVIRGDSNQIWTSRIHGNAGDGIRVESGTGNNITSGNSIHGNGGLSIDLGADGPSPNDPLDADTGANDLQNAPQLLSAVTDFLQTRVTGRLDARPNTVYRIDLFYGSPGSAPEMRNTYQSFTVTTAADGLATFDRTVRQPTGRPIPGNVLSATATDPAGNTSEVSAALAALGSPLLVTNTESSGAGSLYDAVGNAGFYPGADTIRFEIPGAGPHRILAPAGLPQIFDTIFIDATTQPGYAGTPLIELMGPGHATGYVWGIHAANGAGSVIRGLAIGGFHVGIVVASPDARIEGCYVGLDAAGAAAPNGVGVMSIGERTTIGGTVAAARNVISANAAYGLDLLGRDNVVLGNYIGTNPAGALAIANQTGVYLSGTNNLIGGTVAGARNVISGNTASGLLLALTSDTGSTVAPPQYNRVVGNYIGMSAGGAALGNGGDGVNIVARATAIGGIAAGEGNVIAFNMGAGVRVMTDSYVSNSGVENSIRGNAIYSNRGPGIDLAGDGATSNDPLDADTGANDLQNFPVISFIGTDGASTRVAGSVHSRPNTDLSLDFYAAPADGSAQAYLGSLSVTTDASGNAPFSKSFAVAVPPGQSISATATSASGSTSEFSATHSVPLPGDTNRDRSVNFFDLTALAANYGSTTATWADGDFDGNGIVNFFDLTALAANYSASMPVPAVPIPSEQVALARQPDESSMQEAPMEAPIQAAAPIVAPAQTGVASTASESVASPTLKVSPANVAVAAPAPVRFPAGAVAKAARSAPRAKPMVAAPLVVPAARERKKAFRNRDGRPIFAVLPPIRPVPRMKAPSAKSVK